ncbi:MAG: penicillin-binding protein 2 [Alphaproteobacteria bacterium]|nr:penicillin-binding protein 2 [Alphaproteobacteria bacterium]
MSIFSEKNKKKNRNLYMPGEEINIGKKDMFAQWDNAQSFATICKTRIMFGMGVCILVFFIVALRLFGICVLPNMYKPQNNTYHEQAKPIHRTNIVDVNGNIVATSLPTVDLNVNAKNILSPRQTSLDLVKIFSDLDFDRVYKILKKGRGNYLLKKGVTPHQQALILKLGDPGLEFINNEKRVYPHKGLLSHIVGFTNIDNQGLSGIEKGMEDIIVETQIPLRLTIDIGVQDTIRSILYANVKKYKAAGATAILMDVNNGEIISSVSLPDFDPNNISKQDIAAQFNKATFYVYEPGSVLKIFNTAMALDGGKIRISESFDATEPLKLKAHTIRDFHPENRWLSVEETLVHSSNIASARIALKSGFNEQYNFLKKIKFMEKLKLEIIETAMPLVPPADDWEKIDSKIATIGYGYGISVTPLHIISAYSAMINGGIYHNPSLVKKADNSSDGVRVISDNTSKQMRKLMRAVVTKGSGKKANILGYDVGGKTGTANKLVGNRYDSNNVVTTFVSAFPISNPQYALLVMMDSPKRTKETFGFNTAGWNSVPTAAEIIEAVAPQLNVQANYDLDEVISNKIIEASYGR